MSIPFEAIDVQLGRRIDLNLEKIYNKVILRKRGGYCYELNLLFHTMLTKIGFENYLISARIIDNEKCGPEFDHMAIIVKLDDLWLADVGFGDLFIEPILIKPEIIQEDKFKKYVIKELNPNEFMLYESLNKNTEFRVIYRFKNKPRKTYQFDDQNNWKQSSKDSYFVKNRICTLPTEKGRITILNDTYKIRTNGDIKQLEIVDEALLKEILRKNFNIEIENNPNMVS